MALADQYPIGQDRDLIAEQQQRVSVLAERDDRGVTAQVPDDVGQHDPLDRRQPVEQAVHDQQVGFVHAGGGEPRPPGYQLRCGPQRDLAPGPEVEPVQDGRDQQAAVPAGLTRAVRGLSDQSADRDRRPGPDAGGRQADPGPDRAPSGRGGQVVAEYPQFAVGRRQPAGQQADQDRRGRRLGRDDAERGPAEAGGRLEAEAGQPDRVTGSLPAPHPGGEHLSQRGWRGRGGRAARTGWQAAAETRARASRPGVTGPHIAPSISRQSRVGHGFPKHGNITSCNRLCPRRDGL